LSTTIWRISKQKYATTAFSGEGSRRASGRWNSKGTGIVYTSSTLALAALETFVHIEIEDAQNLFVAIRAEIPDEVSIENLELTQLPNNWRDIPAPRALALIGDQWYAAMKTSVLEVPSVVIPFENNYLLNPLHPDFQKIQIYREEQFIFDRRIWKNVGNNEVN